jgi:hypothetical protein
MDTETSRKRLRHGAVLKAQILAERAAPGTALAKVETAHGIKANIVHSLRKLASEAGAMTVPVQFVSVAVSPTVKPSARSPGGPPSGTCTCP